MVILKLGMTGHKWTDHADEEQAGLGLLELSRPKGKRTELWSAGASTNYDQVERCVLGRKMN